MNKEIKEILDKLKDDGWYDELDLTGDKWIELKQTETKQILDYITDLQQEIKEANDSITWWTNRFRSVERDNKELKQTETKQILDYITNLQQENERLKEWKEDLLKENIELEDIRKEAIEYIKRQQVIFANYDIVIENQLDILLNILQGSDKE